MNPDRTLVSKKPHAFGSLDEAYSLFGTPALDQLFDGFGQYVPLNDMEKLDLASRVTKKAVRRKQYILQEGDSCKHYTFVVEGCFKKFQVDEKGVAHNLQFIAENDWVIEVESFYKETLSRVFIEAIEPAVIFQITWPNLIYLFSHHLKFDRYFRVTVENRLTELENRILQAYSATAEDRYLSFLAHYPQLSQRLPNTQIASYLGMPPEFLSTIRKNIAGRR